MECLAGRKHSLLGLQADSHDMAVPILAAMILAAGQHLDAGDSVALIVYSCSRTRRSTWDWDVSNETSLRP